jgi:hypothetical protein
MLIDNLPHQDHSCVFRSFKIEEVQDALRGVTQAEQEFHGADQNATQVNLFNR